MGVSKVNPVLVSAINLLSNAPFPFQEPSVFKALRVLLVIPTRSCQKFSKQICLWDLVQGIGIIFIIQIVETI